jgi:hypothetical protein
MPFCAGGIDIHAKNSGVEPAGLIGMESEALSIPGGRPVGRGTSNF